ncbi:MAG: ABC transporter permease subunit [Gammaproteobacteria bacterium]
MMLRLATPLIFLLLLVPVLAGIVISFLPAFGFLPALGGNQLTLQWWQTLADVPGITHSVSLSLIAGLVTPLIALILVLLFLASASGRRLDSWTRRLISPVLAVPHAAAAFGLVFLIAPSGFLFRLFSPALSGWDRAPDLLIINDIWGLSLIAGLVIKEIPFLMLVAMAALPQINPEQRLAMARTLGYSPVTAWLKVIAPALYPLLRLPLFAVIAYASANIDVALILGPNLPATLSVRLLDWFADPDLDNRFLAAAAAILQLGVSALAISLWIAGEKLLGWLTNGWMQNGQRRYCEKPLQIVGRAGVPLALSILVMGLLLLLMNAFAGFWRFPDTLPDEWTLRHWRSAGMAIVTPLSNTLRIAVPVTGLTLVLVVASLEAEHRQQRERSLFAGLLYLPLIIPQVAFLFGLIVITELLQWQPGYWLVALGHILFVLPYMYLTLAQVYRRFDTRWLQLGATLGATANQRLWRIRLPMLLAPLLTSAAIGLAISISLYLPTQLLGAGRISTITTEAVALASGGSAGVIAVWASLQAILPMLAFTAALVVPQLVWRQRAGMRDTRDYE